jgi:hypothetical protein
MLTIARRAKATGETIPTTPVSDISRMVVKITPNININEITPEVTTSPRGRRFFRLAPSEDIFLERKDRKPG